MFTNFSGRFSPISCLSDYFSNSVFFIPSGSSISDGTLHPIIEKNESEKKQSYFHEFVHAYGNKETRDILTIAERVSPNRLDLDLRILALIGVNFFLPLASGAAVYAVAISGDDKEKDESLYAAAFSTVVPAVAEQLRVNTNRYAGKWLSDQIMKYINGEFLGTNGSGDIKKRMNRCMDIESDLLTKNFADARIIEEYAIGKIIGYYGNWTELLATGIALCGISQNVSVSALDLASCFAVAIAVQKLASITGKTKKNSLANDELEKKYAGAIEGMQDDSMITLGGHKVQKLLKKQEEYSLEDAWEQGFTISARDSILETNKHWIKYINRFLLGEKNRKIINICSIFTVTMYGSVRRISAISTPDGGKFTKSIARILNRIEIIDEIDQLRVYQNDVCKKVYGEEAKQELGSNSNVILKFKNFKYTFQNPDLKFYFDKQGINTLLDRCKAVEQTDVFTYEKEDSKGEIQTFTCDAYKILSDISLESGKCYKLFGVSGSGKSSLFDALKGRNPYAYGKLLFGCNENEILLLNNTSTKSFDKCSFIELVAPEYFNEEFDPEKNDPETEGVKDRLMDILEWFNLTSQLPNKEKTSESPKKSERIFHGEKKNWDAFCGGEGNKIIATRILMKKVLPKLVILDEIFVNLDTNNEKLIFDAMKKWLPNVTIIFVKHERDEVMDSNNVCYDEVIDIDVEKKKLQILSKEVFLEREHNKGYDVNKLKSD